MFLKLFLLSGIVMLMAMAGLAITMLIRKNGRFPDTHVGHNREMRKRGIKCAKLTDTGCNPTYDTAMCESCGTRLD